jgi:hypothetical protein
MHSVLEIAKVLWYCDSIRESGRTMYSSRDSMSKMSRQQRAYSSNWNHERVVLKEFFGPPECAMKSALIGWSYEHSSVDSIARCHFGLLSVYCTKVLRVLVSWYDCPTRFAFRHRLREGVFDAHDHGHAGTKLDALRYRQFLPWYFNALIDADPLICDCEKVEEGMPAFDDDEEGMPVLLDGASDDDIR